MPFVPTTSWFLDIDYVVSEDQEILIVDQFTGRTMEGRRYSDGLHQAIEAKRRCSSSRRNQNICVDYLPKPLPYVRSCQGWQGQGKTEEEEFREIYNIAWFQSNQPSDCPYWPSRPSLPKLEIKIQGCCGRCQVSSWKRTASPSRYRCRWNQWLPFSIVGSSRCPSRSFEWKTTTKKRKLSWTLVNVVLLPLLPTWPDVVPTSSLVKVFANSVDFVSSGQNVTKAVGLITSFVDVQDVKGIQVNLNSTCLWRWIDASFRFWTDQSSALIASSWVKKNQWSVQTCSPVR